MSSRPGRVPERGPSAPHAATSRPGSGFASLAATPYAFGAGNLDVRGSVGADLLGHRIEPGSELCYVVLPEWHDAPDGFAADAVALDLVFASGARLSDHAPVDQYGVIVEARAQHEGRTLHPDQWNLVRVDLNAVAGEVVSRVEVRVADTRTTDRSTTLHGWIEVLGFQPIPVEAERPVERARTRQGSMSSPGLSRGNTAPTVAVPGGFVGGIPVTRADSGRWPYSWHADNRADNRPALQAFATSHLPSPWMGDRGVFHVMPALAAEAPTVISTSREGRALGFSHDGEVGRPHDYHVHLDGGILGEMTATDHTILLRFTFPPGAREGVLIFDQIGRLGELRLPEPDPISPDATLTAFTDNGAAAQADRDAAPRAYLHAHLDRPVVSASPRRRWFRGTAAPSSIGWVRVALDASHTVTVRLATSFIGTAQAARNLVLDGADADFDTVRERAAELWDAWIGRVDLPHASIEQRAMMATALYRVGLFPSRMHENLGTAEQAQPHYVSPFHPVAGSDADRTGARVVPGELSVNHGFWDTYRTAWPLYALLDPALTARMLDGFVEHYRSAGWTSRWAAPGPIDSMTGTSNDIVLADAVAAGVPTRVDDRSGPADHRLDLWSAFDSAVRNATSLPPRSLVGRKGLATAPYRGWVDTSVPEGLSWTLDGAINDLAVARLAEALQDRVSADHPRREELDAAVAYFTARATSYSNVFDTRIGFFVGRDPQGRFRLDPDRYDPRVWGYDYTETNGWGTAFTVPHDGAGLAALHGGRAALGRKLEQFFATPEAGDDTVSGSYSGVIHEMVEARNIRAGQWAPSNQPAHHIPFMALFAGRPDIAQDAVRTAVERMFTGGEIGQGWPGDEDNGEMAAWWVFAALGLYPLVPGTAGYVLVAPSVTDARVRLGDGGAVLTISAPAADRTHRFIRSVRLNGEPWHRTFVPHTLLADGATISFELSAEPEPWGTAVEAEPPSLTASGESPKVLHDLTSGATVRASSGAVGEATRATDDDASTPGLVVGAGEWIEVSLPTDEVPELLTLTLGAPGDHRFRLECLIDGEWQVALDADATFRWSSQLRPFVLPACRSRTWRLLARSTLEIRQLELLVTR